MRRKFFLFTTIFEVVNFLFTMNAVCQASLSFSDDSIIVESCGDGFQLLGVIEMYTHTKELVTIRWDITELRSLTPGEIIMIVDPYQYVPHTTGAFANISNDTTDILFHMWPDTILPGDTALIQIGVFDTKDSANTYQLLTTIVTCPLSSGVSESELDETIRIYPNPFNCSTTLEIKNDLNYTQLVMYNMMGEVVKNIDIQSPEIELYREDLPQGIYLICLMENQVVRYTAKVVVSD